MSEPIVDLLVEAGLPLRYAGTTRGGEWHGPCPACRDAHGDGGEDRLCVWPVEARAWCRRCNTRFSLARLLAAQTGIPVPQACARLGVPDTPARRERTRPDAVADPAAWAAKVERVVASRAVALERCEGEYHLEYLRSRGLHLETMRRARLGTNVRAAWYDRADFGLRPEQDPKTGEPRRVCLPEGVVIPYLDPRGRCVKLQVRCDDTRQGRYRTLTGSRPACMVLLPERGEVRAAVVVESALDALLCQQEVPEGYVFVALGSTVQRPDAAARTVLDTVPHVLVATDSDDAGDEAFARLQLLYPESVRLTVPPERGKDPGEAYAAGVDLYDWCELGYEAALRTGRAYPTLGPSRKLVVRNKNISLHTTFDVIRNAAAATTSLRELRRGKLRFVDIETAPLPEYADDPQAALDPHRSRIRLLQVTDGHRTYVFDLDRVPLRRLAPIFDWPWVAHNAVFELKHLLQAGLQPSPPCCTQLLANAIYNRRFSLAELARLSFQVELNKREQTSDWSARQLSESQLLYAAEDAAAVSVIWSVFKAAFRARLRDRLAELLYGAQYAVALMELRGIGFDAAAHRRLMRVWRSKRKAAAAALAEMGGPENLNSYSQVASFFEAQATKAQLAGWPRTSGGQLSTSAKELSAYADVPAVAAYLEYQEWNTRLKNHGESLTRLINPATGRLHARFLIAGAETGRMSASGPNVQALPREPEFRALFVPGPGHAFVRADYNQMQLRIAAMLSDDPRLLAAYERGDDVHRLTAARVLGKDAAEVTTEERGLAKAIAFGILFGMGAAGLRRYARQNFGVELSESRAERVRSRFFEAYPELERWQRERADEGWNTGSSRTPMGRVRRFEGKKRGEIYTASMNTPVQGGEAEVMLAALGRLPWVLGPLDACLVNCVHDELLVECPEARAEEVAAALRACMEAAMRDVFPKASLVKLVDVGIGPNWAEAK